jgi:sulfotransferase
LLAALLRQNPRFHARMTSPIARLFQLMLTGMSEEGSAFLTDAQRQRLLAGLFTGAYADCGRPVVFDTSRAWTACLPALLSVCPDARLICPVRHVSWVMDSLERVVRGNPLVRSRLFADEAERATVYSRTEALGARNRLVGAAWTGLKEAYYGPQADRLLLVDYDYLARRPQETMGLIYSFLGEEPFAHDFSAVSYDEPDFDAMLATPGLHRVRPEVRFEPRRTLLPPDLFERFAQLNFWHDTAPSRANRITEAPDASPKSSQPTQPPDRIASL